MPARSDPALSMVLRLWAIAAIVPLVLIGWGAFGAFDFSAFWIAGKQVLSGEAGTIYNSSATQRYADQFTSGLNPRFPYPPHALFIFISFALLPYIAAYFAWNVTSAVFFWWAAKPYLPQRFPSILTVLTPAALISMDFGQTGLLVGALWLLAFRGKWAAVALLTFKPHLGLLSALSLRSWENVLRTAALALGLVAASAALFGPSLWAAFWDHTLHHGSLIGTSGRWLFVGVSPAMAYGFWGWIPFAVGGGLLLARKVNVFTAATASFLISPFGFHYDMPVACLGFGLLLYTNWPRMPLRHRLPIAFGFIAPVIAVAGVWWIPPILLWALWAQTKYDVAPGGTPAATRAFTSR